MNVISYEIVGHNLRDFFFLVICHVVATCEFFKVKSVGAIK